MRAANGYVYSMFDVYLYDLRFFPPEGCEDP